MREQMLPQHPNSCERWLRPEVNQETQVQFVIVTSRLSHISLYNSKVNLTVSVDKTTSDPPPEPKNTIGDVMMMTNCFLYARNMREQMVPQHPISCERWLRPEVNQETQVQFVIVTSRNYHVSIYNSIVNLSFSVD